MDRIRFVKNLDTDDTVIGEMDDTGKVAWREERPKKKRKRKAKGGNVGKKEDREGGDSAGSTSGESGG